MESIVGIWRIISFDLVSESRGILQPFGEALNGLVYYLQNGFMSGIISGSGRPDVSATATLGIPDSERVAISRRFIAYAGKYTIEDNTVFHHVEVSFVPNLMRKEAHRNLFEVQGNRMTTRSIPKNTGNEEPVLELSWERIGTF